MSRFACQAALLTPSAAEACVQAAASALSGRGGKPVVQGSLVTAQLGRWLTTRFFGGAFVPPGWLPTTVTISIEEGGGGRRLVVSVAERFGFGTLFAMETRMRTHCAG